MDLFQTIDKVYYDMSLNELRLMNDNFLYPKVTYNSLLYLDLINYTEKCTASKLAKLLCISKSAVTVKVNELMRQGLVHKVQSEEDKRVYYLTLQAGLLKEYQQFDRTAMRAAEQMKEQYTAEQLDCFCKMLESYSQFYRRESGDE